MVCVGGEKESRIEKEKGGALPEALMKRNGSRRNSRNGGRHPLA